MAQQNLNYGVFGNDGTGAPIRVSFGLIQANFTEVYTALAALQNASAKLIASNNLSDLPDKVAARNNLGLGTAAARNSSGSSPTVASVTGTVAVGNLAVFADTSGSVRDGGAVPTGGGAAAPTGVVIDGSVSPYAWSSTFKVLDIRNASSGGITVQLPDDAPLWSDFIAIDGAGNAGTKSITYTTTGTITPAAASTTNTWVARSNNAAFSFRKVGASPTIWRVT